MAGKFTTSDRRNEPTKGPSQVANHFQVQGEGVTSPAETASPAKKRGKKGEAGGEVPHKKSRGSREEGQGQC